MECYDRHTPALSMMLIREGIEESDMEMMEADILSCYSNKDGGVERPRASKT